MRFVWDESKNQINQRKHGISFETAKMIFQDPMVLSILDQRYEGIEERWFSMGLIGDQVLFVAHQFWEENGDEEVIRIISARKATLKEERNYYAR